MGIRINDETFQKYQPGPIQIGTATMPSVSPLLPNIRISPEAARMAAKVGYDIASDLRKFGADLQKAIDLERSFSGYQAVRRRLDDFEAGLVQDPEARFEWSDRYDSQMRDALSSDEFKGLSQTARRIFEQRVTTYAEGRRSRLKLEAIREESRYQAAALRNQFAEGLRSASLAETPDEIQPLIKDFDLNVSARIDAGMVDADQGAKMIIDFAAQAARLSAERLISTSPDQAFGTLSDPEAAAKVFPTLPPAWRDGLAKEAERRIKELKRGAEIEAEKHRRIQTNKLKLDIRDHLASLEATGVGMEGVQARAAELLSDAAFEEFQRKEDSAHRRYVTLAEVKFMPPEKALAKIESLRPEAGTRDFARRWEDYSEIRGEYGRLLTALQTDPAAYVQQDATVAGDPGRSLALQEAMGVPPWRRRVLTRAQSKQTVAYLQSLKPTEVPAALESLRRDHGKYWASTFQELVDDGLSASTQIVASVLDDPLTLSKVAEANAAGRRELVKAVGDSGLVSATERAVRAVLEPYRQSVVAYSWDADTVGRFNDVESVITDTALLAVSQGKDNMDAAREAVERVILSKYHEIEEPGWFSGPLAGARIPREIDRNLVEEQAEAIMEGLGNYDLDLPEGARKSELLKKIREDATWATLPDDSGLVLMFNGFPVMTVTGEPIMFNFPGFSYEIIR